MFLWKIVTGLYDVRAGGCSIADGKRGRVYLYQHSGTPHHFYL